MIMQKDLRRPQQLARLIDIYGQGQMRNEETMMAMQRQRQESEAINNIAKMYRDETSSATPDISGLNKIINAGSNAVFGLSKIGAKATPIIQAISADNRTRAGLIEKQLELQKPKQINTESRPTGRYKTENDVFLVEEQQVDPYTNKPIPGTAVFVPKAAAPGVSTKASETMKRNIELQDAENLIATFEADKDFMSAFNTFKNAGKFALLQQGKIEEALSGMPDAQRIKMRDYLKAQSTVARMKEPQAKTPEGDGAKKLTEELAKQYLQKAGGDKAKARQLAKDDGYSF